MSFLQQDFTTMNFRQHCCKYTKKSNVFCNCILPVVQIQIQSQQTKKTWGACTFHECMSLFISFIQFLTNAYVELYKNVCY
jgi:hypothetical protein